MFPLKAMIPVQGLTESEARARRQRGEGNDADVGTGRSYWGIARTNLFTFFNNLLFAIGIALVALGQYRDALISVGLGLVNAAISTVQEINAKRKLDRIALLNRPAVTVVREGKEKEIDRAELVTGDVVRVRGGDQVAVDGQVVGEGDLEMDESLLTGEPDLVPKRVGDALLSGSFCVSGDALYEAEKVGAESFANRLTRTAREFRVERTPLQKKIDFVVRINMLVVALISLAILLQAVLENLPFTRIVQISAVLSGQVPYGLFFLVAVAYTLGAATIAKRGALVQQVNAIESLSNVDVLCMDKTGTLTANRLRLHAVQPLAGTDAETARLRLGAFVRSASATNPTSEVLAEALPGEKQPPADEVPFASSRKWSALAFEGDEMRGVYALGAVEMLAPFLPPDSVAPDSPLSRQVAAWSEAGLRVLVFARNEEVTVLHDEAGQPRLPSLTPVALVALGDELRPQARETIAEFAWLGIRLKIISGDDPRTVAALARQVGLPPDMQLVSGPELARMTSDEFDRVVEEATIFGRISPEQKERIVESLARRGHYVAMMGDGVNDALSLKKAKLGIAMQSGSNVTRNVADMVLLDDSFAALRPAFTEGKRIAGGLSSSMYLLLTRIATATLVIMAITMIGLGFPYEPSQGALVLFTVGIPSFFLTLWARPEPPRPHLLRPLVRFVVPAAILTALFGVAIYAYTYTFVLNHVSERDVPPDVVARFEAYTGLTYDVSSGFGVASATIVAQTNLSIFVSLTAFLLILFLEPPFGVFTGWTTKSPDRRPALLALGLFVVFMVVILTPALANYFGLLRAGGLERDVMLVAVPLWFLALRTAWRTKLFERFLSVDDIE